MAILKLIYVNEQQALKFSIVLIVLCPERFFHVNEF